MGPGVGKANLNNHLIYDLRPGPIKDRRWIYLAGSGMLGVDDVG